MAHSTVRPENEGQFDSSTAERLLRSAAKLSYDPAVEVDWDTPLDKDFHGQSPEWNSLYGTA
ncbi:diiron oxygenase, partial [Streptomyces sp. NPDC057674]